ncbi:hypothetical protein IFR05_016562 [Cadophora sp. M221]|nr:hypothetical protein IFR05_016562 [Cadophora sp. M221]
MCSLTLPKLNLCLNLGQIFKLKDSSAIFRGPHKIQKYRTRKECEAEMERRREEQRLAEKEGYRQDKLEWQRWEVGMSEMYIEAWVKQCPGCEHGIEVEDGGCYTVVCVCGRLFCYSCTRPWDEHATTCNMNPQYYIDLAKKRKEAERKGKSFKEPESEIEPLDPEWDYGSLACG